MLDACNYVGAQPFHVPFQLDVGDLAQDGFQYQAQLESCEVRADTEVLTATKGEVLVRAAVYLEAVRFGEDRLPISPPSRLLKCADEEKCGSDQARMLVVLILPAAKVHRACHQRLTSC